MEERKVIRELLDSKQYTRLRQMLSELNDADIAALLEEMEEHDMLKYSSEGSGSGCFFVYGCG